MGVNLFDRERFREDISIQGYHQLRLDTADVTRESIIELCEQIGTIMPWFSGDPEFDLKVETITPAKEDELEARKMANSQKRLGLHTDASSIEGIPPRYTVIACKRNDKKGGDSLIKDSQPVLEALTDEERGILSECGVWNQYDRGAQRETGRKNPILFQEGGVLGIRFRGEVLTEAELSTLPPEERDLIERVDAFTQSPEDVKEIRVQVGAVLILDNWRILHARTEINDPNRVIYRVLIS